MAIIDRSTRRTSSSLAAAALGGLLILALAGCGGAATPNPVAPAASTVPGAGPSAAAAAGGGSGTMPADVCALLSAGELQSATGIAFDAGKSVAVTSGLGCEWDAKTGLVSVNVFSLDHAQFVFNRDHLQGKPISGLGDEAWAGGLSPAVSVAKGALEIDVQVAAPGMTNDVTVAETALAKLVVSRL
jgi:hypothetical protein